MAPAVRLAGPLPIIVLLLICILVLVLVLVAVAVAVAPEALLAAQARACQAQPRGRGPGVAAAAHRQQHGLAARAGVARRRWGLLVLPVLLLLLRLKGGAAAGAAGAADAAPLGVVVVVARRFLLRHVVRLLSLFLHKFGQIRAAGQAHASDHVVVVVVRPRACGSRMTPPWRGRAKARVAPPALARTERHGALRAQRGLSVGGAPTLMLRACVCVCVYQMKTDCDKLCLSSPGQRRRC
jgi:hypothetical protein